MVAAEQLHRTGTLPAAALHALRLYFARVAAAAAERNVRITALRERRAHVKPMPCTMCDVWMCMTMRADEPRLYRLLITPLCTHSTIRTLARPSNVGKCPHIPQPHVLTAPLIYSLGLPFGNGLLHSSFKGQLAPPPSPSRLLLLLRRRLLGRPGRGRRQHLPRRLGAEDQRQH